MRESLGLEPDRSEVESVERVRNGQIRCIPISAVLVEDRIRKDMGDIEALAESIRKSGLLHPIVVDEEYRLLAGERRLRASIKAGLSEIEVRVFRGLTALEKEIVEIDENTRRKDFSPNELARYYVQKKEYVEAALKMLAAEQQRKADQQRQQERRQFEELQRSLALKEEELDARLREFDARLESEDDASRYREVPEPSAVQVAKKIGVAASTLSLAESHVAAMDRYPFLDHKEWNQHAALEVASRLKEIEEHDATLHTRLLALLAEIGEPKRIRVAVDRWHTGSAEKRQRMRALLLGADDEGRSQVAAYLAGNGIQPDARRVRLHGIVPLLATCCQTEDAFQKRFTALHKAASELNDDLRKGEEERYGWLR